MNKWIPRLLLIAAIALALVTGFNLAYWFKSSSKDGNTEFQVGEDEGHVGDEDHDAESAPADEHDDHGDEAGHGEEEGAIPLSQEQIEASGIEVVAVGRGGGNEIRLSGRVEPAIGGRAAVAASIGGRVQQVLVAPGDRVEAGAPLAVIVSGEAATLRATVEAARADADAARRVYQRDQTLAEQGIVARQDMEASRARSLAAEAAARAATAHLQTIGSADASGRVTITSPTTGVVGSVGVAPGGVIVAGALVAQVSDPDQNELVFNASPTIASQIAVGLRVDVTGHGKSFQATIIGVAPDISEVGGATLVRAKAAKEDLPPAGSPVAGTVVTSEPTDTATVPADAVQTVEGRSVVFVATSEGFRATPVLVGRRAGNRVEVLNGLAGDERVAGSNAFLLKAELAKGEAGHDH